MPWKCYIVELVEQDPPATDWRYPGVRFSFLFRTADGVLRQLRKLRVGAMWRDPDRGIAVKLPGCSGMNVWYMSEPGTNGFRWALSGDMPNVTATPSINFVGSYHGWVQGGVVTEDCEGRKFDDRGKLVLRRSA
jgi:hypothetical protein